MSCRSSMRRHAEKYGPPLGPFDAWAQPIRRDGEIRVPIHHAGTPVTNDFTNSLALRRATTRKPSCLISINHSGPMGACLATVSSSGGFGPEPFLGQKSNGG